MGFLTDFSIPEIFQFIEKGRKSGLLAFSALPTAQSTLQAAHYIWTNQGYVVAAANRLDHQGLIDLIKQHHCQPTLGNFQEVSLYEPHSVPLTRAFDKLVRWCCPLHLPLGNSLKHQGILQDSQLKELFNIQVSQQVCSAFQLKEGLFQFNQNTSLPTREMTGLSVPATEAMLIGLRVLDSWNTLIEQLPDPNEGLIGIMTSHPLYSLDELEFKVWKCANQTTSLKEIAQKLNLPINQVLQVAFRLAAAGLVAIRQKTQRQLLR
jgi:hypothetical protein